MTESIYVFASIIRIILTTLEILMLVRAVFSWFPMASDSALANFTHVLTEPVVIPVRAVLERFEIIQSIPIDIPFFIAFVLVVTINGMLV